MTDATMDEVAETATRQLLNYVETHPSGQCFLLLDPVLRPVETEVEPWQHFANLSHRRVPVAHASVPAESHPFLCALAPGVPADKALLTHSVQEACAELAVGPLRKGQGRRIGGWIVTQASIDEVALHLGRLMVQRHPSGHQVWLRLQDPAVLWYLVGWLEPSQKASLLGPIDGICYLNPAGKIMALRSDKVTADAAFEPNANQWAAIDCIEPMNTALREWGGVRQPDQLEPARATAFAAICRAKTWGFDDVRDLALFARYALVVHPGFDLHPQVSQRLRARRAGDYFGGLVADIEPGNWQRIAKESPSPESPPGRANGSSR